MILIIGSQESAIEAEISPVHLYTFPTKCHHYMHMCMYALFNIQGRIHFVENFFYLSKSIRYILSTYLGRIFITQLHVDHEKQPSLDTLPSQRSKLERSSAISYPNAAVYMYTRLHNGMKAMNI